jgi:hypothetical protein
MRNTPDFATLSVDAIPTLSDAALAAAACAALDTLRDGPGALEGSLELLEGDEVDALYKTLWSIHMIPTVRHVPDQNPYAEEETGEVQEAFVGLLREAMTRYRTEPRYFGMLLEGVGDTVALELANRIDAWRDQCPTPI